MTRTTRGLPGEFMLLFTVLVWLLFLLIYLGNRHNKLNLWCFLSGMCFSMGVLKEYLYFTLFPELMEACPQMLSGQKALAIYSVLTAALYYLAMPAALVFGMYFCRLHEQRPRLFYWVRMLVFLPALAFGLYYPYIQTRYFQLCDQSYLWIVSVYSIACGVLLTGFAVAGVTEHQDQKIRRQKTMVAGLGLIPIWYWLVTVFLFHLLGVTSYFKAWQGNLIVILLLIAVYLYNAFQDGFMGIRPRHESYDWNAVNESLFN